MVEDIGKEKEMITLIVILVCLYKSVFSDWSINEQGGAALILAAMIEGAFEVGIFFVITLFLKRTWYGLPHIDPNDMPPVKEPKDEDVSNYMNQAKAQSRRKVK